MNTPSPRPDPRSTVRPPARVRLVCRVTRRWCVVSDPAHSRHVASCPECREFFAAHAALDSALHRDTPRAVNAVPATNEGFERRILQAVRNSMPERAPAPARIWNTTWLAGAAVAALAVTVVVFNRGPAPAVIDSAPVSNTTTTAAESAVIVDAVESLSTRFVDSVIPSAGALVADNPLQQEFGSMYSGVRSALDFLALNFLPATTAPAAPAPTRTI